MNRARGGARRDFVIEAGRETAFRVDFSSGVLRNFELGGQALHEDDDVRTLNVLTDDERPLVFYDGKPRQRKGTDDKE